MELQEKKRACSGEGGRGSIQATPWKRGLFNRPSKDE